MTIIFLTTQAMWPLSRTFWPKSALIHDNRLKRLNKRWITWLSFQLFFHVFSVSQKKTCKSSAPRLVTQGVTPEATEQMNIISFASPTVAGTTFFSIWSFRWKIAKTSLDCFSFCRKIVYPHDTIYVVSWNICQVRGFRCSFFPRNRLHEIGADAKESDAKMSSLPAHMFWPIFWPSKSHHECFILKYHT